MLQKIILQSTINFLFAGYLIYLWSQNRLVYYIHSRYEQLVWFSALFMIVVTVIFFAYLIINYINHYPSNPTLNFKNIFKISHKLNFGVILNSITVIFLVVVISLPPKPLIGSNSDITENSQKTAIYKIPANKTFSRKSVVTDLNLREWYALIQADLSLKNYKDQKLELTGFVADLKSNDKDMFSFQLSRYILVCCAVDASAMSLPVLVSSKDNFGALKESQWVKVSGYLDIGNIDGEEQPVIKNEKIESIAEPEFPYLYY